MNDDVKIVRKEPGHAEHLSACVICERIIDNYEAMYHVLESIERRAGSASRQSGWTDAMEVAEWARETLKKVKE